MYIVGRIARQTPVCPVSASLHLACLVSLFFPVPAFFFFFFFLRWGEHDILLLVNL